MADETDAGPFTAEDETEAIVLDPADSARQYYHEPHTGLQREIWRPGKATNFVRRYLRTH